jgi:hypothetical protein
MLTTDAGLSDLQRYKNLRRHFLRLAAAFIPMMVILAGVSQILLGNYVLAQLIGFCTLAILAVMWIRLSYWPCPQCGKFIGWWPPLAVRCRHCGFPGKHY